jgi:hypothetical protein
VWRRIAVGGVPLLCVTEGNAFHFQKCLETRYVTKVAGLWSGGRESLDGSGRWGVWFGFPFSLQTATSFYTVRECDSCYREIGGPYRFRVHPFEP